MSLIPKKRVDKQDPQKQTNPVAPQRPLNTCSKEVQPKKLIALRRINQSTDLSAAKIYGGGVVGGDIRGGRKESVRTIEGGEQGGTEGEEPTLPGTLQKLIHKANIAFKRKQDRESKRPAPVPKIDRVWFSEVTTHFPRAVPPLWDSKHRALAKHLSARIGPDKLVGFVKWSVSNWVAIIQTKFAWMTQTPPPPTPSFPFLVKFVHVFTALREETMDAPLEVAVLTKGLNLARKTSERREPNTPPKTERKLILPKKDLSDRVAPLPKLPDWRD